MKESEEVFAKSCQDGKKVILRFRALTLMDEALLLYADTIGYPKTQISELYSMVCHDDIYKYYKRVFTEILTGTVPVQNSMNLTYLSSLGIDVVKFSESKSRLKGYTERVFDIHVPPIMNTFLERIIWLTGTNQSTSMLYRSMTEKVFFRNCRPQIEAVLKSKEKAVKEIEEGQKAIFG
jgi:hypothetical protein